ncbi:MAG TPA: SDR family oxidoreductase [Gemmatimonadaceae bacterium]|nr:SDR family oxidoreductase [Gemmatimonadaceae bacterium]
MQLRDAKVLVTGGSSGIGLATARLLTERGAKVAISGRRENRLRAAAKEIGAALRVVAETWPPPPARAGPGGTVYASTKFALTGMTQSWRAELRASNVRVMQINPSEVQTEFFDRAGASRETNETKLRGDEIAQVIASMLELDDRGMMVEATVWATNPK